jgi:hypothetical protein
MKQNQKNVLVLKMINNKHSLSYALSDDDIREALNNKVKIIKYNNLNQIKSINELLKPYNNCVILYEWGKNIGHWTCLSNHPNGDLDFFDPYGYMPDDERAFIPNEFWQTNYLSQLLEEYNGRVFYNEHPLQVKMKDINTCGRWVLARLIEADKPLDIFTSEWMNVPANKRDFLVTLFTNKYLK